MLSGLVALLLLAIPPGRDIARYPDTLHWGVGCGRPDNRAREARNTQSEPRVSGSKIMHQMSQDN